MTVESIPYLSLIFSSSKKKNVTECTMSERLNMIAVNVITPFRSKYGKDNNFILGKQYVHLAKLSTLFKYIEKFPETTEPSGSRYIFNNGKRYYENLGLVFFHNDPTSESYYAKEWIWPELTTVNFHMELNNGVCRLFYKEHDSLHLFKEFTPQSGFFKNIKDDISDEFEGIVRCSYDLGGGDWVCYEVHDGFKVDLFDRVCDVLEVFAQRVGKDDLIKKFVGEEVVYQTPSVSNDVSPETTGLKRNHSSSFEYSPDERVHSKKKYEN